MERNKTGSRVAVHRSRGGRARRRQPGPSRREPKYAVFLGAIVGLLLLAACGVVSPGPTVDAPTRLDASLDFEIELTQGAEGLSAGRRRFASLVGQGKPVVLNFWAGLCPPCRAEMPDFQYLHETYGERVLIVGLDVGPFVQLGTNEDGLRLLRQLGITYVAGTTADADVVRAYGIVGMPTTVFFAADGRRFTTHAGLMTRGQALSILEQIW